VRTELPAGLRWCGRTPALIQQALANLIHNACVHTPPTAAITLSAGADEAERQIWMTVADNDPACARTSKAGCSTNSSAAIPAGPAVSAWAFHRAWFRRGTRRPHRGAQPACRRRALYDLSSAGTSC